MKTTIKMSLLVFALAVYANANTETNTTTNAAPAAQVSAPTSQVTADAKKEAKKACKKMGLKGKEFKDCVKTKSNS